MTETRHHLIVRPHMRTSSVKFDPETDTYKVSVCALPINGRANSEVIELMARYLKVSKAFLALEKGHSGRYKTIILSK